MAITIAQELEADGTCSGGATFSLTGVTTSAGHQYLVLIATGENGGHVGISSVTDSAGNTYSHIGSAASASNNQQIDIYMTTGAPAALSAGSITAHNTGSSGTQSIIVVLLELVGANNTAANEGSHHVSGAPPISVSGTARTVANDLLVCALLGNGGTLATLSAQTFTDGAPTNSYPNTSTQYLQSGGTTPTALSIYTRSVAGTATQSFTASTTSSGINFVAWILAIEPAPVSGNMLLVL